GRGLADQNAASGVADVGAVEAEANAAHQLRHVVLGEIGVGTARAASGTIDALADTAEEQVAIKAGRLWMQLDDLLKGHVLSSLVRAAVDRALGRSGGTAFEAARHWLCPLAERAHLRCCRLELGGAAWSISRPAPDSARRGRRRGSLLRSRPGSRPPLAPRHLERSARRRFPQRPDRAR